MKELLFSYFIIGLFGLVIGCAISYHVIRIAVSDAIKKIEMYVKEINDKLDQTKN
ncbi:hypothetical protein [Chryseobacterium sp. G0162]|uniref:hypothetical protein n=1 Tax=Chryseobacterium sp. G0162 TaxID=2487063 RepID=UPI0013DE545F|nr:hypothetical protein [Chryseobacterium sp. G0162]